MILKNVASQGVYLYAVDTSTAPYGPKTGDGGNITGSVSLDGGSRAAFATTNPTQIDATNMPGVYWQPLAQGETNGNAYAFSWKSSTSGVFIQPILGFTSGINLPTAAPGATGGLLKIGTSPLPASGTLAAAVWDEINTGATHNVTNSTGKQLRTISGTTDAIYPLSGTVNLTAATSTTATLDASASAVSQAYQWDVLNILTGTGAGQSRIITNYTTGRVATVSPAFTTTPDTSSTFDITPTASVQVVSYIAGQSPETLVWRDTTAGDFTVSGSIGKSLFTSGNVPGAAGGLFIAGTNAATTVTTSFTTTFTGNLTGNVGGNVTGTVGGMTAVGLAEFFTTDSTKTYTDAVNGSVVKEIATHAGGGGTADANIVSVNGTTFSGANVPAILADGVAHGGTPGSSTATFAGQSWNLTAATGPALTLNAQDNGATAFYCIAPSGEGARIMGGGSGSSALTLAGTGRGINIASTGNDPNFRGVSISARGNGYGLGIFAADSGPAVLLDGPFTTPGPVVLIDATLSESGLDGGPGILIRAGAGHGIQVAAAGSGNKALLLAGDAATDSLAIAAGSGSPINIFDAAGRVLGRFDATGLAEFFSIDSGTTYSSAVNGSVVKEIASHAGGGGTADVNVVSWLGTAVATPNVAGVPIVDIGYVIGIPATLASGTAQDGSSTTITLDAGDPAGDNSYVGRRVAIVSGTGIGQARYATANVASTKVLTVHRAWTTTPDATSQYTIDGLAEVNVSDIQAAALAKFFTTNTTKVYGDAIGGSVVHEIATGTGSDPWAVSLPGIYSAGTAGYIVGNRLDVTVSSRSTYAGTDTPGTATLLSRIGSAITINGGAVAIDWAHVVNPTSTVALTNTTISSSQAVASVSGNVGGTIAGFTAGALAQFFTLNTTKTYTDAISGSVVHEIAANSSGGGGGGITAADVWAYGTRTLTSLGATAPAGWINAASIVSHALDGKGDWSTYAGGDTPGTATLLSRIGGPITITGGGVNVNLAQTLSAARLLTSVGDTSLTLNDAMHCAVSSQAGQETFPLNTTTYTTKTPAGTVLQAFTTDSSSNPRSRT